jgi:hypothetical protein
LASLERPATPREIIEDCCGLLDALATPIGRLEQEIATLAKPDPLLASQGTANHRAGSLLPVLGVHVPDQGSAVVVESSETVAAGIESKDARSLRSGKGEANLANGGGLPEADRAITGRGRQCLATKFSEAICT